MSAGPSDPGENFGGLKLAVEKGIFQRIKGLDFQQLLIVILLVAILAGGAYGFKWAVEETKSGMLLIMADHAARLAEKDKNCVEEKERAHKEFLESLKEERAVFERTLDRIQGVKSRARSDGGGMGMLLLKDPVTG